MSYIAAYMAPSPSLSLLNEQDSSAMTAASGSFQYVSVARKSCEGHDVSIDGLQLLGMVEDASPTLEGGRKSGCPLESAEQDSKKLRAIRQKRCFDPQTSTPPRSATDCSPISACLSRHRWSSKELHRVGSRRNPRLTVNTARASETSPSLDPKSSALRSARILSNRSSISGDVGWEFLRRMGQDEFEVPDRARPMSSGVFEAPSHANSSALLGGFFDEDNLFGPDFELAPLGFLNSATSERYFSQPTVLGQRSYLDMCDGEDELR